jgi:hypothetical protein
VKVSEKSEVKSVIPPLIELKFVGLIEEHIEGEIPEHYKIDAAVRCRV